MVDAPPHPKVFCCLTHTESLPGRRSIMKLMMPNQDRKFIALNGARRRKQCWSTLDNNNTKPPSPIGVIMTIAKKTSSISCELNWYQYVN
jgi:hypothetical protein